MMPGFSQLADGPRASSTLAKKGTAFKLYSHVNGLEHRV
jgi:hypothetical protein